MIFFPSSCFLWGSKMLLANWWLLSPPDSVRIGCCTLVQMVCFVAQFGRGISLHFANNIFFTQTYKFQHRIRYSMLFQSVNSNVYFLLIIIVGLGSSVIVKFMSYYLDEMYFIVTFGIIFWSSFKYCTGLN